jgi:hypothetical protein
MIPHITIIQKGKCGMIPHIAIIQKGVCGMIPHISSLFFRKECAG